MEEVDPMEAVAALMEAAAALLMVEEAVAQEAEVDNVRPSLRRVRNLNSHGLNPNSHGLNHSSHGRSRNLTTVRIVVPPRDLNNRPHDLNNRHRVRSNRLHGLHPNSRIHNHKDHARLIAPTLHVQGKGNRIGQIRLVLRAAHSQEVTIQAGAIMEADRTMAMDLTGDRTIIHGIGQAMIKTDHGEIDLAAAETTIHGEAPPSSAESRHIRHGQARTGTTTGQDHRELFTQLGTQLAGVIGRLHGSTSLD